MFELVKNKIPLTLNLCSEKHLWSLPSSSLILNGKTNLNKHFGKLHLYVHLNGWHKSLPKWQLLSKEHFKRKINHLGIKQRQNTIK